MSETIQGINYRAVEDTIKAGYREITSQYRRDDEIEVRTENHRRLAATLKRICASFREPIHVLDLGCGTGRYFHCLQNVAHLTGIDFCEEMLEEAREPVRAEEVSVQQVELRCGNAHLESFPAESFHFIYSLGMFGHGCPVTREICDRFYYWLKPDGKLLFNLVDFAGLPLWYRARRQVRAAVYSVLSPQLQRALDKREQRSPFFGLTRQQLQDVMLGTRFADDFVVVSQVCKSPLWPGRHLECLAHKAKSG